VSCQSGPLGEVERTEGEEDNHPDADVDLTTTVPVLEDRSGGINVVGGDDQTLQEVIVIKGKSDGRIHETSGIVGEAALVWNAGWSSSRDGATFSLEWPWGR